MHSIALICLQLLFEIVAGHQHKILLLYVLDIFMNLCCLPAKLFTSHNHQFVFVGHIVCAVMLLSQSTGTAIDAMPEGVVCVFSARSAQLVGCSKIQLGHHCLLCSVDGEDMGVENKSDQMEMARCMFWLMIVGYNVRTLVGCVRCCLHNLLYCFSWDVQS